MTNSDQKILKLFLETFRQQLLDMAEAMGTRTLRRSDLDNVFAFKIAGNEEKAVIHEMVSEVTLDKGTSLRTGREGFEPVTYTDHVATETNGSERGKAKRYANNHYHSDRDAA